MKQSGPQETDFTAMPTTAARRRQGVVRRSRGRLRRGGRQHLCHGRPQPLEASG
jgi:hypothetical protein